MWPAARRGDGEHQQQPRDDDPYAIRHLPLPAHDLTSFDDEGSICPPIYIVGDFEPSSISAVIN